MPSTLFAKLLVVVLVFCIMMTTTCIVLMRGWHTRYHQEVDQIANRDTARLLVGSREFSDAAQGGTADQQQAVAKLARLNPAWISTSWMPPARSLVLRWIPGISLARVSTWRQSVHFSMVRLSCRYMAMIPRRPVVQGYFQRPQSIFRRFSRSICTCCLVASTRGPGFRRCVGVRRSTRPCGC